MCIQADKTAQEIIPNGKSRRHKIGLGGKIPPSILSYNGKSNRIFILQSVIWGKSSNMCETYPARLFFNPTLKRFLLKRFQPHVKPHL